MTDRKPRSQLDLFSSQPAAPSTEIDPALAPWPEALHQLAENLPPRLKLGSSSWTFADWGPLVYRRAYRNKQSFTRDSLAEYAMHPLMTTVGVDRSHYSPLSDADLTHYASQLPEGFRCVLKVWDELTTPQFPDHPRYGTRRGQQNPHFMDASLFLEAVLGPLERNFEAHLGPLVLEVPPSRAPMPPRAFAEKLEGFLAAMPEGLQLAVELRNRQLLTPRYLDTLRAHQAIHVLNFWTRMPTLAEQLALPGVFTGPAVVSRVLLPPRTSYADRKRDLSPFDRLQDPQPAMRQDVVDLLRRSSELELPVYVLVNNKAEGCAPLSIRALAEAICEAGVAT